MAKISPADGEGGAVITRGKTEVFASPTGRNVEYTLGGRCGDADPFLIYCSGMSMPMLTGTNRDGFFLIKSGGKKLKDEQDRIPFKLVLVGRAGYEKSTLNMKPEEWTYGEFAKDVAALADHLGAKTFSVIGLSSGGPNALAVAAILKDRVEGCFISGGDANYAPGFPKGKKMNAGIPEGEPVTYTDGSEMVRTGCCKSCCCLGCCGCCCPCCCPKGVSVDLLVEMKPLEYKYEDITCPVLLVHGEADDTTDVNCARFHKSKIPHARLEIIPKGGHCQIPDEQFWKLLEDFQQSLVAPGLEAKPAQEEMA